MKFEIITGDCLESLKHLPDNSIHCCVTSPPYWGLRDYGTIGQLGLEESPDLYVAKMVEVFREVRRVLRDDGTLWLNLGDSYANNGTGGNGATGGRDKSTLQSQMPPIGTTPVMRSGPTGLKTKDLVGIPWLTAFALRADGWYLRQDIIWAKPNPMPESVRDRCTKSHEYIFMLTKSARYFYDAEAIKEPAVSIDRKKWVDNGSDKQRGHSRRHAGFNGRYADRIMEEGAPATRNRRDVWFVATEPFKEAHFATFPRNLIEPCVLAGTSDKCCASCGTPWKRVLEKYDTGLKQKMADGWDTGEGGHGTFHRDGRESGEAGKPVMATRTTGWTPNCKCPTTETKPCVVLDPFCGSGTTGVVALKHGRDFIGLELNPEYSEMSRKRISGSLPETIPTMEDWLVELGD